jgi:uncharacterized protein (TIGR02996 family)
MNEEEGFLQSVQAHPGDTGLRLVYADWLEERGDVRGEFIRVQEEMNALPAYSDRYAELKPRRNALREQIDAGWRAKLGYPRHRPMFTQLPERRVERWRVVEEFIDTWHKPLKPGDGDTEEELRANEERLGFRLPSALREWYALAGKRHDVWTTECRFVELSGLRAEPTHFNSHADALIFYWADNVAEVWGIRQQDLGLEDPPIFAFNQPAQVSSTVTVFAIMALLSNFNYQPILAWANFPPNAPAFGEVEKKFQKCALTSCFLWGHRPFSIYEGVDILAEIVDNPPHGIQLSVAARTEAAYSQLSEELRGQLWRYTLP